MSNLSELLPAGSSVKSADFVAQGTLASGVTVGLRSDGKVEAIAGVIGSNGTAVQFSGVNYSQLILSFPVPSTSQIVVAWQSGSDGNKMKAKVGTVTGNVIVFSSTAVEVSSGLAVTWIAGCFETGNSKVVFAYTNNNNLFQACAGSVSGTGTSATINLGTRATLSSARINNHVYLVDNPSSTGKVQLVYREHNVGGKVASLTATGGSTVSIGSVTTITSTSYPRGVGPTASNDKTILIDAPNGGNHVLYVGSYNSGNDTWSFNTGSPVSLGASDNDQFNDPVIAANGFIAVTYRATYPTVKSFTLSGTTLTQTGTALVLSSDSSAGRCGFAYDATAARYVFAYRSGGDGGKGKYVTINFSGTAFTTLSTTIEFTSNTIDVSLTYLASQGKTIFNFSDGSSAEKGMGQVYAIGATNVSSYIGITDQAISSAATGKVVCKGGAITKTGLAPLAPVLGTAVAASSANNGYVASAFDSSNNKVVIAYNDNSAGAAGKAIVGTVSGNSISYGSAVTFEAGSTTDISIAFDSNANKVVIAYKDGGNSNYGTAIVGTVSGTSISFGTAVVFALANTDFTATTFDSNLNKIVIAYRDVGNSNYGTAIVGTVSGTSISFGTEVVYNSGNSEYIAATFDSNSNKVVVAYNDGTVGNLGKAIVGTVSGTSISFGSEATFNATQSNYVSAGFDSNSNKVVVLYSDVVGGSCVVGTVSGTSISFGTETRVGTSTSTAFTGMSFDPVNNKMILAYRAYINSAYLGNLAIGTVSGTSITVSDATTFTGTSYAAYCSPVYDSNTNRTVLTYQSGTAPYPATAQVLNLSSDLTPNTAYFVQDDGTISTTSSTTKAGTALSTTSLLLTG